MKKIITLFIAAALTLSLAACGSDDKGKVSDSNLTAVSSEEDADTALIKASKAKLLGTWTVSGLDLDLEQLTFNEDGTGTYEGIFDKKCTFTYTVSTYHQDIGNGKEKVVALMSVNFSTGEAEDITFEIREETNEKLVFHNSDYTSGYHGYFNFDDYIRA